MDSQSREAYRLRAARGIVGDAELLEQRQVDLRSKNLLPPLPEGGGQPQRR